MQLHAVLRHANLLMTNIKKPYAFHPYDPSLRESAEMSFRFGELRGENLPHFSKVLRLRRTARALAFGRRDFSNHSAGNVIGISQHQVEVAVAVLCRFLFPAQQHSLNGINLLLRVETFVTQDFRSG